MKAIRRISVAVLAGVLTLLLTACGSSFDAGKYVQAGLDATIHGEFTDYVEIANITEEEAQEQYDEVVAAFTDQIAELGLSDEMNEKYRNFFIDLLKKTKYEVTDVQEKDGDYDVDVSIQPVQGVFDGLMEELEDASEDYIQEVLSSGEIPSEEEITEWAGEQVYSILSSRMDDVTYGDAETVTVAVTKDDDGVYNVSEQDITALSLKLIDLGDLQDEVEAAVDAAE